MSFFSKFVLASMIAFSLGLFSMSATAEVSEGRIVYAPKDAIDLIIGKVKAAINGIGNGANADDSAKLIKEALDSTKELNASDLVGMRVQKATTKLRMARGLAKEGKAEEAKQGVQEALKMFEEIKGLI